MSDKRRPPEDVADALYRCTRMWTNGVSHFDSCRGCPYNEGGGVTCPDLSVMLLDAWLYVVALIDLMKKMEDDGHD